MLLIQVILLKMIMQKDFPVQIHMVFMMMIIIVMMIIMIIIIHNDHKISIQLVMDFKVVEVKEMMDHEAAVVVVAVVVYSINISIYYIEFL